MKRNTPLGLSHVIFGTFLLGRLPGEAFSDHGRLSELGGRQRSMTLSHGRTSALINPDRPKKSAAFDPLDRLLLGFASKKLGQVVIRTGCPNWCPRPEAEGGRGVARLHGILEGYLKLQPTIVSTAFLHLLHLIQRMRARNRVSTRHCQLQAVSQIDRPINHFLSLHDLPFALRCPRLFVCYSVGAAIWTCRR